MDIHKGHIFMHHHHHQRARHAGLGRYPARRMRGEGREFGHEGGGRRRRLFDGEQLRLMILALVAEQPRHGYELIRAFTERSSGAYTPSPGMIYPLLALLADEGLIAEVEAAGARKSFTLTPDGSALRDASKAEADGLLRRLATLADIRRHVDSEPARRAMHNLRTALIARLTREDADSDTLFRAVALIDGTTQAIERL